MARLRKCVTCGEMRKIEDYAFRNKAIGKRWNTCKACQSLQRKKWYQNNKTRHIQNVGQNRARYRDECREFLLDYLVSHPCVDCGETNLSVLEFDHVRGTKSKTVSELVRHGYSLEILKKEIAKCEVRCANCHRIKTSVNHGWWR